MSEEVQGLQQRLSKLKVCLEDPPTPEEVRLIKSALGSLASFRHTYACPKGHIYFIDGCGSAAMESRCPKCGAVIGGSCHRLAAGNKSAIL